MAVMIDARVCSWSLRLLSFALAFLPLLSFIQGFQKEASSPDIAMFVPIDHLDCQIHTSLDFIGKSPSMAFCIRHATVGSAR
jgi:hypothetical protein